MGGKQSRGLNATFEKSTDKAPFEVLEVVDDTRHIRFSDGEEAYVGIGLSDEEIILEKAYNDSRDYDAELEEAYNDYLDSMTAEERYNHDHGIKRVKKTREYDEEVGFFSSVSVQEIHNNPDGTTLIEETEQDVYVTPDGSVYYLEDMAPICEFYEKHKNDIESHKEILTRKQRCDEAFDKMKRHEELYNLEQVSFICAYLTHTRSSLGNPGKDRIPLLSAKEMNYLFDHYKRYKTINLDIIPKRLAEEEAKAKLEAAKKKNRK